MSTCGGPELGSLRGSTMKRFSIFVIASKTDDSTILGRLFPASYESTIAVKGASVRLSVMPNERIPGSQFSKAVFGASNFALSAGSAHEAVLSRTSHIIGCVSDEECSIEDLAWELTRAEQCLIFDGMTFVPNF